MPDARIQVHFPLGGENRRGGYAQRTPPFTTPGAVNVRSVGPLEKRARGGSRPGLVKYLVTDFGTTITALSSVTYLDASGVRQCDLAVICDGSFMIVRGSTVTTTKAYLVTDTGDKIVTDDGKYIIYESTIAAVNPLGDSDAFQLAEKGGKIYIADATLKRYNPLTGTVETVTGAPASQPLVACYQERIVLAGADHMFYMSAEADETDWDAGADMGNMGRSVMGYVGDGGKLGEVINSILSWRDRAILFGTDDSLWAVYGNPVKGEKKNVSPHVGVLGANAICATPGGMVLFLARTGLYLWQIGSDAHPTPFSSNVIPEDLQDVDVSTIDVTMKYDHRSSGVHLFMTPHSGVGSHWWIDLDRKALWPVKLMEDHQPLAAANIAVGGYSDVLLGCKDGYLRRFSNDATTDDGELIYSHLLIGPFHLGREDGCDGMLKEIVANMADDSGEVKYKIVTADTAEDAVDLADNQMATIVDGQY